MKKAILQPAFPESLVSMAHMAPIASRAVHVFTAFLAFLAFIISMALLSCVCPDNTVYANSPPLIMKGDTAFPISSENIKLESEVIKIHYGTSENHGLLGHEIEVIFNFHNTGFETDLDIGFPNVASYAQKLRDFEVYDYPSMTPYETEIKEGGTLPEHGLYYYNYMYTWKMHFEENERKSIYVRYKFESEQWGADYILVTGALWKDRIDKIDVYVDFPEPAAFSQITASPLNYYYNGQGIEWHFENIEPDFNLFVGLVDLPAFYGKKDEYFKPRWNDPRDTYRWDDYFYYIDLFYSYGDMGRTSIAHNEDIDYVRKTIERLKDTNQLVINEIYARHGYDFKTGEWEKIFEDTGWYEPDPGFTPAKFNSMEHAIIAYICNFNKTIITDGTDEELINSINEFHEKYNGKDIFYREMTYPYYQYTYGLVSSEKERIKGIDEANGPFHDQDGLHIYVREKPYNKPDGEASGDYTAIMGKPAIKTLDIPGERKIELHENGIYVREGNADPRCIFRYQTYLKAEDLEKGNYPGYMQPLETIPQINDDIIASPAGNYVLAGMNYELDEFTNLVENSVYVISVSDGSAFKIGKGDLDDFITWWSPSENIVCWQNVKNEPGKLKIYNIPGRRFLEINLPHEGIIVKKGEFYPARMFFNLRNMEISDLVAKDDGKIIAQVKDKIYYININSETREAKSIYGVLTAVYDDSIYFYKGSDICMARLDEFKPERINSLEHSIWKSKKAADNLLFYYGGAFNLSVFNTLDKRIYWYRIDDYQGIIKPSPEGSRLFIYRDYYSPFTSYDRVREALIHAYGLKGRSRIVVDGADDSAEWLDNNRLLIHIYEETSNPDKKHILSYIYEVETGERHMTNINIDSFTSRVVNEFRTASGSLTYEARKPYSKLKEELKKNAWTTSETTTVYTDNRLLYTRDEVLSKGLLVGLLEEGAEASKVCYFTGDNVLYTGWIRNSDFATDMKLAEPAQGFIYNAKIYEFEEEEPKAVFEDCSSQVRILGRKPGWVYINAVDRIFGWVREEEVKFGFFAD
ncbi:MAG: YARHG domain-containing protein [Clostridiaceae bacterium]|nr:YARHG domain-containing protein [Clostridiaceae bacterium]